MDKKEVWNYLDKIDNEICTKLKASNKFFKEAVNEMVNDEAELIDEITKILSKPIIERVKKSRTLLKEFNSVIGKFESEKYVISKSKNKLLDIKRALLQLVDKQNKSEELICNKMKMQIGEEEYDNLQVVLQSNLFLEIINL